MKSDKIASMGQVGLIRNCLLKIGLGSCLGLLALGCHRSVSPSTKFGEAYQPPEVIVNQCAEKITLDGRLNEKSWQTAPSYPFIKAVGFFKCVDIYPEEKPADYEAGSVRFLIDDNYLYVATQLQDSDVIQTARQDRDDLYLKGDTVEVMLKSRKSPRYVEFHFTPNLKRDCYFYECRQYPRLYDPGVPADFRGGVQIDGTFNDNRDRDQGWTCEFAIPRKIIENYLGAPLNQSGEWTILASRYNYIFRATANRILSSFPQLPMPAFHMVEYYAPVKFLPPIK